MTDLVICCSVSGPLSTDDGASWNDAPKGKTVITSPINYIMELLSNSKVLVAVLRLLWVVAIPVIISIDTVIYGTSAACGFGLLIKS